MNESAFGHIDDAKISKAQWLIVVISGMGFFTDAYDLFVIGVALKLITKEWHLSPGEISLIGATSLASAAIGSLIFGRVALGAYAFPLLLSSFGIAGPMATAAVISIVGLGVTVALLPEPKGISLEQASKDDLLESGAAEGRKGAFAPSPA